MDRKTEKKLERLATEVDAEIQAGKSPADQREEHLRALAAAAESEAARDQGEMEKALAGSRRRRRLALFGSKAKSFVRNTLFVLIGGAALYFILSKLHIVVWTSFTSLTFFILALLGGLYFVLRILFGGDAEEE